MARETISTVTGCTTPFTSTARTLGDADRIRASSKASAKTDRLIALYLQHSSAKYFYLPYRKLLFRFILACNEGRVKIVYDQTQYQARVAIDRGFRKTETRRRHSFTKIVSVTHNFRRTHLR